MTIVSLARFIGLLPKPGTSDHLEKEVNGQLDDLKLEVSELRSIVQKQKRKLFVEAFFSEGFWH